MYFLLVLAATLFGGCVARYTVYPQYMQVAPGEGLELRVGNSESNSSLRSCSVRFGGYLTPLVPGAAAVRGVTYWGAGLQAGQCGARLQNVQPIHNGSWIFYISTTDKYNETAVATVYTTSGSQPPDVETAAELGQAAAIDCSAEGALYCRLSNPHGQIVLTGTNCTYFIPSFSFNDVGIWQCARGVSWAAQQQIHNISIQVKTIQYLEVGHRTTDEASTLYCNDKMNNIKYCRWERSDGQVYLMAEGRYIDRYSYYGRGISNNDCGITIPKPLQADDFGKWTCVIGLEDGTRSGGFVTVLDSEQTKLSLSTKQPKDAYFILNGTQLTLDCTVDTSLSYCWFKHPNGTRYYVAPGNGGEGWQYHGDSLLLGQCGLTITTANTTESGLWTCGMGVVGEEEATQDLQFKFKVTVLEIPFREEEHIVTARTGDNVTMACRTLQQQPLQYCSFFSPNGTGYNLVPGEKSLRYSYHGAGLQYGECGINIKQVEDEDYGTWQCATKLLSSQYTEAYLRTIHLAEPSILSSNSTVGVAVGAVVAAAVVAITVIWYRKKRTSSPVPVGRPFTLSMLSEVSDDVSPSPQAPA